MSEPVAVRAEQETMLITVYLHALDAGSSHPILGDPFARELTGRIDYDFHRLDRIRGNLPVVCARARLVDEVALEFLARHDDAVVLHLGCGIDSRVRRLEPGPGVSWFDVDQEPVIDLRRRLYPDRPGTIATSVTTPGWARRLPAGRPQLVIAEGLLMYLDPAGISAVLDEVLALPAPARLLVADAVAPWVRRVAGRQSTMRTAGTGFRSDVTDLTALADARPEFRRGARTSVVRAAAAASPGATGAFLRLFDAVPAGSGAMTLHTWCGP